MLVGHKKVNGEKGADVVLVEIGKVVQYTTAGPSRKELSLLNKSPESLFSFDR